MIPSQFDSPDCPGVDPVHPAFRLITVTPVPSLRLRFFRTFLLRFK